MQKKKKKEEKRWLWFEAEKWAFGRGDSLMHLEILTFLCFISWRNRYKALKDMRQQIADRDENLIEFANA